VDDGGGGAGVASDAVVEFRDVCYSIDGRAIVGPLNLQVARGETLVLVGQSGSGKTTTLRLVNRLLEPSTGTVLVEDRSILDWNPIRLRRRIGYVIQEVGLFPHLTVADNVALVPRLERWEKGRIARRVPELLHLVGLDPGEFGDRYPHQLSGGQRQRVGFARALAADPPILLCDEPFGAVDPITRSELQTEFKNLTARLERTVLFVTHDVAEAVRLGSRIALFETGQLVFVGNVRQFAMSTSPPVVALRQSSS
jgi:osmoprotectant transport system ATP-binding protein